jgi:hypothetical protein
MKGEKMPDKAKKLRTAAEQPNRWTLLDPEGVIRIEEMKISPRPSSLEGKTVMLRANGKHNSEPFLDRVAELLEKEVKGIKTIKSWHLAPETNVVSHNPDRSREIARTIAKSKPDLVIASNAD